MDTASLVIGIISVIVGFIPCIQVFVFIPAVVGLILGVVSFIRKRQVDEPTGMAVAGIILNLVPILVMTALALFVGLSADANSISPMTIK